MRKEGVVYTGHQNSKKIATKSPSIEPKSRLSPTVRRRKLKKTPTKRKSGSKNSKFCGVKMVRNLVCINIQVCKTANVDVNSTCGSKIKNFFST